MKKEKEQLFINMNKRVEIYNVVSDVPTIKIQGQIGESLFDKGYTFEMFENDLDLIIEKNQDFEKLNIEISSYGGNVYEALAIFDAIKDFMSKGYNVQTRIVRASASAATIIAAAGNIRTITQNSSYLIHRAMVQLSDANVETLQKTMADLELIDKQILDIYSNISTKSPEQIYELMKQDKFISAQEALDWGFVNRIDIQEAKIEEHNSNINNSNMKQTQVINKSVAEKEEEEKVTETVTAATVTNELPEKEEEQELPENEELNELPQEEELKEEEKEEEVQNEEEEQLDDKDETIEQLKSEIEKLKKIIEQKQIEEAENNLIKAELFVENFVEKNLITNETKESWVSLTLDKGEDFVNSMINGLAPVGGSRKVKTDIKNSSPIKTLTQKELWQMKKEGKLTINQYAAEVAKLK